MCTLSPGWLLSAHQMVYLLVTQLVLWPNKAPPSLAHSSLSQDGDRERAFGHFCGRYAWSGPRIWTWTLPRVEGWRRRDVGSGLHFLFCFVQTLKTLILFLTFRCRRLQHSSQVRRHQRYFFVRYKWVMTDSFVGRHDNPKLMKCNVSM